MTRFLPGTLGRWALAALLALGLGVYVGITEIWPRTAAVGTLYAAWQADRARIASAEASDATLRRLQVQLAQLHQNYRQVAVRLPQGDEMSALLKLFQEAAIAADLRLAAVRPQPRVRSDTHLALPFLLRLEGRFHALGAFVSELERAPYLVEVQTFTAETADLATATLQVDLTVAVLSLREAPDVPQREGSR